MAAALACGSGAVLSHGPAAYMHGLWTTAVRPAVTISHASRASAGVQIHRSRIRHPADFTRVDGIPVTSVPRTLLDLAAVLTPRRLTQAIDRAERLDLFDLNAIEDLLLRAPNRKGTKALRHAIAAYRPRDTRTPLEDRFLDLIEAASLSSPETNVLVRGERYVHEVDAHFPSHNLVVELDSFAFHHTRLDHERDAAKTADLELAGHRIARFTWDDVTRHRTRTTRRLNRLLSDT